MNFYPFHIGDYASATRHLTWDEDLAYRRLLDCYYTREQPIPISKTLAYRLVLASTETQKAAVDTVLSEFFIETDDGFVHERCEYEIGEANSKKKKASDSAIARWSAMRIESERNANAEQSHAIGNAPNPNPNPNPKSEPKTVSAGYPPEFEALWVAYPSRPGSNKKAAFKAWKAQIKKKVSMDVLLSGVQCYANYCRVMGTDPKYIKQPATFLGPDDHYKSDWTPTSARAGQHLSVAEDRQRASELLTGRVRNNERIIEGTSELIS